jgi:SAM-dependent methyltransferase
MALQDRWHEACSRTIGTEDFWTLCVDHRAAHAALAPLIANHASGKILDAGAGRMAWRAMLQAKASDYVATDYGQTHPDIGFTADMTKRLPVDDSSFDTVFCCSVLEHVENPAAAMSELARVLKPGGILILSVPFRYYLHGAPADYFRFTSFGVRLMAGQSGFEVVELSGSGGFAQEIANLLSLTLAALAGAGKAGLAVSAAASFILWHAARLFDGLDRNGRFSQNVNAVLRKT